MVEVKALSVVRPSGSRIAQGEKTLEVRRWQPLVAPNEDLLIVENGRFLRNEGEEDANGRAVALVRIRAVRPFERRDMAAACASYFEDGWLAWELTDVRPIDLQHRVRAARKIYTLDIALPG